MRDKVKSIAVITLALGIDYAALVPTEVFAQAPYYRGKTITILRGGEPGGSGDMQAKALILFLKKYIAGNPAIIIQNMPGSAGMKAVNHAYSTARPDGLTITAVGSGLAAGPILGLPGAKYDIDKLIYLGSTEQGDPYVFLSRKEAGLNNLEKLRAGVRLEDRSANRRPCCLYQRAHIRISSGAQRSQDHCRLRRAGARHRLDPWGNRRSREQCGHRSA
jgi:tripartite-type tricarboxylate transporter receptor subunit TctC